MFEFNLTQKAKSKGGDKYVCATDESFSIYVPQTTSRSSGTEPKEKIIISFVAEPDVAKLDVAKLDVDKLDFSLTQKAKSKGGDKYVCDSDSTFSIYVPQTISRVANEHKEKITISIVVA